jgi:uncharacterized membrane protein YidH (DUF202 family)
MNKETTASLETLQDIKRIMESSARFLSLSGWSGIWAGGVALAGSFVASRWLKELPESYYNSYRTSPENMSAGDFNAVVMKFITLAMVVLAVAIVGAYYFTMRKAKLQNGRVWNSASRKMVVQMAIPMIVGAIFALNFLMKQHEGYIAPTCLAFYGLALVNGGKYTLSDIQYLGYMELALACICLLVPGYGLTFWAIGFGVLHILYGIIMWNKYERKLNKEEA